MLTLTGQVEWALMLGFAFLVAVSPIFIALIRRTGEEGRTALLAVIGVGIPPLLLVVWPCAWWVALTAPAKPRPVRGPEPTAWR